MELFNYKIKKIWIIDPLDGTTDFVNRTGEFTIMVGLVEKHESVLGLVYWPIKKKMYLAESGKGVFCYDEEWVIWHAVRVTNRFCKI